MSRYWSYFKEKLRYPEIQRGGPLALLAEAEGGELDALYESGLRLREQFFPALAEKESVLSHGRGRGLPRQLLENDEGYRARVINAWAWQWLAGRHWGLHKIFRAYGFPAIRLTPLKGEQWAEFDLEVESPPGGSLDEEVWDLVLWLIFEYKRASAMLRTPRLVKSRRGRFALRAAAVLGERITLWPPPARPAPGLLRLAAGGVPITHERWRLCPGQLQSRPARRPARRLCAAQGGAPFLKAPVRALAGAITHERWTLGVLS